MNARARIPNFASPLSVFLIFLLSALLPACAAEPTPPPPTLTPTATATVTPTIQWFPATNTPTAAVTIVPIPTLDLAADAGPLLFADDFSDDSVWTLASSASGSAGIANNHLTLVARVSRTTLFSLRSQPYLTDFFLEVTATPNLCRAGDEFGLLLRATPDFDYYRFGVSCDGRAHVDRIYRGAASAMQVWTAFPFLPSAPAVTRLAVWADGSEIRLYANGQYLFTITDSLFYGGTLGLFVRAETETGMSVNFTDLSVYSLP
ncbi:MAG: hypothetical protein EPO32_01145 [Anaerolineae bacterium]|nr:MAG: hypothetical protein EPO32_01145 [Anaerolineae bacterium]